MAIKDNLDAIREACEAVAAMWPARAPACDAIEQMTRPIYEFLEQNGDPTTTLQERAPRPKLVK